MGLLTKRPDGSWSDPMGRTVCRLVESSFHPAGYASVLSDGGGRETHTPWIPKDSAQYHSDLTATIINGLFAAAISPTTGKPISGPYVEADDDDETKPDGALVATTEQILRAFNIAKRCRDEKIDIHGFARVLIAIKGDKE